MLGSEKIRIIRPWQTYSVGAVIQPPGVLRDWLLARGIAERMKVEHVQRKTKKKKKR
jgi:hypothetical protein